MVTVGDCRHGSAIDHRLIPALLLARSIAWSISGLIAPALALGRGEQIALGTSK